MTRKFKEYLKLTVALLHMAGILKKSKIIGKDVYFNIV